MIQVLTDRNIRIHDVNDSTIDSFSTDFDNIVSSVNPNDDPIIDKDKARLAFSEFYTNLHGIYKKHQGSRHKVRLLNMLRKLNIKTIAVS